MTPDKQENLNDRLLSAAAVGDRNAVRRLLANGANVHAREKLGFARNEEGFDALCWAAYNGRADTVKVLLAAGADACAFGDLALCFAAHNHHEEIMRILAAHIFIPDTWRGKSRTEIEMRAGSIYNKIKTGYPVAPIETVAAILFDSAMECWHQVRPPPPKIQISPLPAQPRPL